MEIIPAILTFLISLFIANMAVIKSVAIIGAGPAGAISVDALAQEKAFDVIKVFERRSSAGGCWLVNSLTIRLC